MKKISKRKRKWFEKVWALRDCENCGGFSACSDCPEITENLYTRDDIKGNKKFNKTK